MMSISMSIVSISIDCQPTSCPLAAYYHYANLSPSNTWHVEHPHVPHMFPPSNLWVLLLKRVHLFLFWILSAFVAILFLPFPHHVALHRQMHVVATAEAPGGATRALHLVISGGGLAGGGRAAAARAPAELAPRVLRKLHHGRSKKSRGGGLFVLLPF